MFIEKYDTQRALKISQAKFQMENPIICLPFYAKKSIFNQKNN